MSVPRFIDRAIDAVGPLLGGLADSELRKRLDASSVALDAGDLVDDDAARAGFVLAANLLARLYPKIGVIGAGDVRSVAVSVISAINPSCEIAAAEETDIDYTIRFAAGSPRPNTVTVWPSSWNVIVDGGPAGMAVDTAAPPTVSAACAAAAVGVGEVFRGVFAAELEERGRTEPTPAAFNLVTLGTATDDAPVVDPPDLGSFYLVGAGAIGQAALYTLKHADVTGTVCVVDPEPVELSNLQRYVLTTDGDVGIGKTDLAVRAFNGTTLAVHPIPSKWSAGLVRFDEPRPVLVAVDSEEDRIAVQASLPGPIYNAYTDPRDLGWSRHERFGDEPCLACLYWPAGKRPSRHEQIAASLRQHELRVLAYLVSRVPAGEPLPVQAIPSIPGSQQQPPEAEAWAKTSILDDVAAAAEIDRSALEAWDARPLGDLYQEGICGGALLGTRIGEVPRDVLVPLVHQSAYAGVMLATQLIVASVPELRQLRPPQIEGRYNVLSGPEQRLPVPRARGEVCLCTDPDFVAVYKSKQEGGARVEQHV